jgi:hypothetical protein
MSIARSANALVGCDQFAHTGTSTGIVACSLPLLSVDRPLANSCTDPGKVVVARNAGTGTCIATLGVSPTTNLFAGKLVTSPMMTSVTSFNTSVADVSPPKCHRVTASNASYLDPGAAGGGAGA